MFPKRSLSEFLRDETEIRNLIETHGETDLPEDIKSYQFALHPEVRHANNSIALGFCRNVYHTAQYPCSQHRPTFRRQEMGR
jgi:hypothetical protein